jgi:hypothetical protein
MIKIYEQDRLLADVELRDGKLHVRSFDGDWVARSLESLRRTPDGVLNDVDLYNSLPIRLHGRIWTRLSPSHQLGICLLVAQSGPSRRLVANSAFDPLPTLSCVRFGPGRRRQKDVW